MDNKQGNKRLSDERAWRGIWIGLALALMMLAAAACSQQTDKEADTVRTVTDARGEVVVPAMPQRIVDISGASDELTVLQAKLIATANQDSLSGEIPAYLQAALDGAQLVGSFAGGTVDLEMITELAPDLIVSSPMFEAVHESLEKVAPVYVIKEDPLAFNGWRDRLTQLGELLGKQELARTWLDDYEAKSEALAKQINERFPDETFAVLIAFYDNYSLFYNTGLGGIVYEDLGLAPSSGMPQEGWGATITLEGLSELGADHLLIMHTDSIQQRQELEGNGFWDTLEPVRNDKVYWFDNESYYDLSFGASGKLILLEELERQLLGE